MTTRSGSRTAMTGLMAGSLVVLALLPVAAAESAIPTLSLGLLVAMAGIGAVLFGAAGIAALGPDRAGIPAILDALMLWSGCALALGSVMGAVATTAESLQLDSVVLAQEYTRMFLIQQPAGALIFLAAVSLGARGSAFAAILGPPSAGRGVAGALLLVALSALGATMFAGGYAGEGLAPLAWLGIKTLAVLALVLVGRMAAGRLTGSARIGLAWIAAGLGLVNLVAAFAMAIR
jgi:hypothetical protein